MTCADRDPGLAAELPDFLAGVQIAYADVPRYLPDAIVRGVLYEASRTEALLEVPDIAHLHIHSEHIAVSSAGRDVATVLGPYLRCTPVMVLMLLRGGFGANAAALAGPDGAVVVMGRTVSGKSTLAAALMKRGLRLMADDAALLALDRDGTPWVFPVWPELVLWPEAVDALFGNAPPWLGKADCEIPRRMIARERYCDRPMPVKRLYVLRPERLDGGGRNAAGEGVVPETLLPYQPELAAALGDPAALLRLHRAIDALPVQTLAFPQSVIAEMDELADGIVADCGWSHG